MLSITVSSSITPTFTVVAPICSGATLAALPTTSNNGITGTWLPALNNTLTTTYTFTPGAGQCATTATLTITVNSSTTPNFAAISPICSGSIAPVLGTTSPNGITGTWNPTIISNTTTGTYLFTPTAGLCATTQSLTITVNALPIASAGADKTLTCLTTSAIIDGSGSSAGAGYTYTWLTTGGNFVSGNTTASPTVNQAGTYNVTVTNSTTGCAATDQMIVTSSTTLPTAIAGIDVMLSCTTTNISLDGSGSSTGVGYSYAWSTTGGNIVSGGSTITPTVNQAGIYNITVTNTANGCTATDAVIVTNNSSAPTASGGLDQVLTCTVSSITLDGSVSSTGAGITYSWSTVGGNIVSGTSLSSPTINQAGTYALTVTNTLNGCSAIDVVTVTSNTTLPIASAGADQTLTCLVNSATINGSLSSSGVNYTYTWATTGGSFVSGNTTSSPIVNQAGTYNVTVTNTTNGCIASDQMIVISNISLPLASAGIDKLLTCTIASVTIDGSGSSTGANYTYTWATTGGNFVSGNATSSPIINQPGTYTVTVTNTTNGCTATDQMTLTSNTILPTASAGADKLLTCTTASATIDGSGSSSGASYSYTWATTGGNFVSGNTTSTPIVNQAGTYNLTVTNTVNGCTSTDQMLVTSNTTAPTASAGTDKVLTCTITSVTIDGLGSSSGANYTFMWSSIGGNIVSGSTTLSPIVNQAGTYVVIITNTTNGCTSTDQMTVTSNAILPTASAGADKVIACALNTITIDGSLSSIGSNFTYTWATTGGNFVSGNNTASPIVNQAGSYNVTVTNTINGCTATDQMVVTNNTSYPVTTITPTNILCNGQMNGSINLNVSGGNPPYQFLWSNLATTEDLTGVGAGIYSVLVTDIYGCTTTNGTTINEPPMFHINTNPSLSSCYNQPINLTVSATGGTGPGYTYNWSGGSIGNTMTVTPISTTTYTITATDQNGCTDFASVTAYVSPPISINLISNIDSVCPGEQVLLTPVVTGGVGPPYTIINQDGNIVTPPIYIYPQQSGNYSVSVQDACGTQDQSNVYINVLSFPLSGFLADSVSGCEPFTVHFNELYPIDGRTFIWDFGDNENLSLAQNPVHIYTRPGVFTVTLTVTSKWGCKTIIEYTNMITVYPKPNAQFTWTPEFASVIKPIVAFNNLTSNGNTYVWTFGDGDSTNVENPEHRFPGAGSWPVQLIAISNKGCSDTVMYPIVIEEENTLYAPTAFSPDNDNVNDFFFVTGTGIDKNNFLLNVFDRWGEVIFTSTDIEKTWNGCAKNTLNPVQVGTYTWLVIYRDSKGVRHEKSGPVTVIR
jgi:gliding motility-associated-like protein